MQDLYVYTGCIYEYRMYTQIGCIYRTSENIGFIWVCRMYMCIQDICIYRM